MIASRRNPDASTRNPKTLRVLSLHAAGRTPREIARLVPGVSREQIRSILKYRGLTAHPDHANDVRSDRQYRVAMRNRGILRRELETDALCESGEPDRRAWAYRALALGGTAATIAVRLGCDMAEAEMFVRECPPNWTTYRD